MSGRRAHSQERGSQDPRIVDRTPLIVDREPVEGKRRPSSESTRTVYSLRNPISGRPYAVVREKTKYKTKQTESDGEPSYIKSTIRHGKSTLPPAPPVIHQGRPQSVSPTFGFSTMPGNKDKDFVPLPDRIPTEAEKYLRRQQEQRDRERGRESRQSFRQSPATDPEMGSEPEPRPRSRQRRPYSGVTTSNPLSADQERVETSRNYETVTPNEPIRSRNRDRPTSSTLDPTEMAKQYRELKEQGERYKALAQQNYEAASQATERGNEIQGQLQRVTQQFNEASHRETQEKKFADALLKKVKELEEQLEDCKRDLNRYKAEYSRLQSAYDRLAEQRKEHKERGSKNREKTRDDTDSAPSAAEGSGRRRRPIVVHKVDSDEEPRYKSATTLSGFGLISRDKESSTPQPNPNEDMGDAAIRQARADAAKEKAKAKR